MWVGSEGVEGVVGVDPALGIAPISYRNRNEDDTFQAFYYFLLLLPAICLICYFMFCCYSYYMRRNEPQGTYMPLVYDQNDGE